MLEMRTTPNKTEGRNGYKPEAIVLHITQGSFQGAINWIKNPESRVSYHFVVGRDARITGLVGLGDTAWHTGVVRDPTWNYLKTDVNPNFYTVGIGLAGRVGEKPTKMQILATAGLVEVIANQCNIPLEYDRVIPHRLIRSDKKCPGDYIRPDDIVRLARMPTSD